MDTLVLDTPEQIEAFRLLTLKAMLKLEAKGMKRRGPSALALVRAATGLKARTASAMLPLYVAWLTDRGLLAPQNA